MKTSATKADLIRNRKGLQHKRMNTSDARNRLSDVVDTVIGKKRVIFTRYGRDKVALVPSDDLLVIDYLLSTQDYETLLERAREAFDEDDSSAVDDVG